MLIVILSTFQAITFYVFSEMFQLFTSKSVVKSERPLKQLIIKSNGKLNTNPAAKSAVKLLLNLRKESVAKWVVKRRNGKRGRKRGGKRVVNGGAKSVAKGVKGL